MHFFFSILYIKKEKKMDTGDILLFKPKKKNFLEKMISWFSKSDYTHAAMVWKNPVLLDKEQLKGYYVIESTGLTLPVDVEDNKLKFGVQLHKLTDILLDNTSDIYLRKLKCTRDQHFYDKMFYAHSVCHNKPYDLQPVDWIDAAFNEHFGNLQKTNKFYCSALCAFILVCVGALPESTPWSIIRPTDLSSDSGARNITWNEGYYLEPEQGLMDI